MVAEDKAGMALRKNMYEVVYAKPRLDLAKAIEQDAEESRAWYAEHAPLFRELSPLEEIKNPYGPQWTQGAQGPEFHGVSEIYVMQPVAGDAEAWRVWILNSADRKRKILREFQFYSRIEPQRAAEIRSALLKENPDLNFNPWGD